MTSALLCLLLGACTTTRYRSQPYYQQTQVDVGVTRGRDMVSFEDAASASGYGLRITEANGAISKSVLSMIIGVMNELSEGASRTSTSSSYSTSERPSYLECDSGGKNCRGAGYKSVLTRSVTVTTRPRTPEEQAAYEQSVRAIGGIMAVIPMHTDIAYYPQRDNGELWGYSVSSYVIALAVTRHLELASGYYFQRLSARVVDDTTAMEVTRKHRARGIPFRITVQPVSWFSLHGELFLNQLAFDDDATGERTHGARISGALALPWMQRLYLRLGLERNRLGEDGTWGSTLDVGARF